ncbi:hypothetical protein CPB84DRAFT_823904 [Gymnopilus junonius]|uniref:Uncharacterized protein n=1 Tax=Gymnopilus junonius TaxID=109634 RepID=A0A9P5NQL4_GYMJU|nr:hypothetical protein CPB84DRAFT_823904 [Gymnopilus junonius]
MGPLFKLGTKVFTKKETEGLSLKKPRLHDKIPPNSQSTPLYTLLPPGAEVPHNKPVYKGHIPLRKSMIILKLKPDEESDSSSLVSTRSRVAPGLEKRQIVRRKLSPPQDYIPNGRVPQGLAKMLPASKPSAPPSKIKEVARPIRCYSRREEESDDSGSFYSINGATVYNEDIFEADGLDPIYDEFPSPPPETHRRCPSLRDVIKPVNQFDIPPGMQKELDLLPPNTTTSHYHFQASKERKKEMTQVKVERERIFREREAQLLFHASPYKELPRLPARDPVMQSAPLRVDRRRGGAMIPQPPIAPQNKVNRNVSNPVLASRINHSTCAEQIPRFNLGPSARLRDGPTTRRRVVEQSVPSSRPADYASATTAYLAPASLKFDEHSSSNAVTHRKLKNDSHCSYRYCYGTFTMHPETS